MPAMTRPAVRVVRHYAPDLQRQAQALLRLLGQTDLGPETAQPQAGEPGADNDAAVASGSLSERRQDDDTTPSPA